MKSLAVFCCLAFLASCGGGGSGGTGPSDGTIHITTTTSGTDGDPDGYMYAVDGGTPVAISITSAASVSLPAGSHSVALTGIASNCVPTSAVTIAVAVTNGQMAHADFAVNCLVRYSIIGATTGSNPDIALLVSLDATNSWQLIGAAGPAVAFPGLALGSHTLHIAGIAPNCVLTGSADRSIVVSGIPTLDAIIVTCSAVTRTITFGGTRDGGHDLYSIHPDGSALVRITSGTPPARFGRYSPDGTKIVYQSPVGSGYDIAVMNANGTGSVSLTTDGSIGGLNRWPDWHPRGLKILYQHGSEVWTMDPDGSHQALLHSNAYHARYSPDGNWVAFDDGVVVWIMNAEGGGGAHVILPYVTGVNLEPSWSPDGTKILFISNAGSAYDDVFSANADGTGIVNLTQGVGGDQNGDQDFSPDGTKISYRCNPNGGVMGICIMDANGSNRMNILLDDQDDAGTTWHP